MHQRRTFLLALLVIMTLAVAAWWLWNLDAGDGPRANEESTAEERPLQHRGEEARPDAPASTVPAKPAPEAATHPETKPEAKPEAAAYDEPAQIPVYGDLLKRGGAVITFDLRDAQGQWLIDEPVSVRLIRRLGRYSTSEDCYWSFDDGTVVCDGESSAGLEPGNYELEVVAGRYGWKRHTFDVQRGEKSRHELRLPYWRRIITCSFVDLRGRALPFLTGVPTVETTKTSAPDGFYPQHAPDILRLPPTPGMGGGGGRGGKGGFAYRRASGGGRAIVYVTDGGLWHVAVFAGAPNRISAESPGADWPGEDLVIEGTFDSAADSRVEFRMDAPSDLDTRYAQHYRMKAADPGDKSLLDWAARKGVLPPADDPADVFSGARIVLDLGVEPGFQPALTLIPRQEDGIEQPYPRVAPTKMTRRGSLWYAPVALGDEYWLQISDDHGFESVPERIRAETRITRIARPAPTGSGLAMAWALNPTLDAWAIHRQALVQTSGSSDGGQFGINFMRATLLLSEAGRDALAECSDARLVFQFGADAETSTLPKARGPWGVTWRELDATLRLPGADMLNQLDAGTLQPASPRSGLYFRAVDPWGAGLPWVEATLHALEDDARAQRLRDIEIRGNKDGWRPDLSFRFANARERDPSGLTEDDLNRERVREFVGEDFERECKDDADLKFYLRTGAWYDSYTRLRGGEYGYHIDLERKLTPGKKYVLYLWSNSRHDLRPDARIVFQAAEVTDLGVITLPAYTE